MKATGIVRRIEVGVIKTPRIYKQQRSEIHSAVL